MFSDLCLLLHCSKDAKSTAAQVSEKEGLAATKAREASKLEDEAAKLVSLPLGT